MAWSGATVFHVLMRPRLSFRKGERPAFPALPVAPCQRGRRCALGRSDPLDVLRGITERGALPRCSYHRDHPARVSTAVGRALASQYNFISAAPPSAGSAHGGRAYRPKCAAETAWLSVLGAAAVRRGSYPPALGAWRAEWCQSSVRRHAAVDHKLAAGHPRSFV